MGERAVGTMSDSDALLWTIGRDPVLRTTIVAVMALDRAPRFADVQLRTEELTRTVPRLRSRVLERPLGWGRPRFCEDAHFNLDLHLRRVVLPAPATFRSVLDLAQAMATTSFDPQLPLWESVVVEGIDEGSAAYIVKLHHALVDGVGGIAVLLHLLDRGRRPLRERRANRPSSSPGGQDDPGSTSVSSDAPVPSPGSADSEACAIWRSADYFERRAGVSVSLADGIEKVLATAESAARLLAPARKPISPLMTERSIGRRFEVLDLSLPTLRRAAKVTGGTINDMFVAGIMGGLRRYHELNNVDIESLRALMPVNVRGGEDSLAGNRFVPARFIVPVTDDPAQCVREAQRIAGSWKHAPGLKLSDVVAAGLELLPPPLISAVWGSMLKGDDFCVTNVPGPPFETYLAGSRVERVYAFAPPSGAALNVALVTPAGRACVGINVDDAAVPDSPKLAACLADGFDDVLRLGRGHHRDQP